MSSKKQRRRREKLQRHEWEYVEIDGEGNEAPVEAARQKTTVASEKPKAKQQNGARRTRPIREVKPPSWSRALKRGALFVPFLYIFLTAVEHVDPLRAVGVALLYSAVFVPMFFFVDRMAYRTYKRRTGEG